MTLTKREKQAIEALKTVASNWPEKLWLFTNGSRLYVLKTNENGERVYKNGSVSSDMIIDTIDIPSDGGDW